MKARAICKIIKRNPKSAYPTFEGTYTVYNEDGVKLPTVKSGIRRLNQLDALIDAAKLLETELSSNDLLIY